MTFKINNEKLDIIVATGNNFVHLRTKTEFSLLSSLIFIEELSQKAHSLDFKACAITDNLSLSGGLQFSSYLSKKSIKPIIGMSIVVLEEKELFGEIALLAKNQAGYRNLLDILYQVNFNPELTDFKGISMAKLSQYKENLICLTGGIDGYAKHLFKRKKETDSLNSISTLHNIFKEDCFIELGRHGLENEKESEDFLLHAAKKMNIPLVATNEVSFLNRGQFDAFDALSCVRDKDFISSESRSSLNSEFYFKSATEMVELFSDIPEATENSVTIAKKCSFFIKERKPKLPSFDVAISTSDETKILEDMTKKGLEDRITQIKSLYTVDEEVYRKRLAFELNVINGMEFGGYFLVVSDFINWAKKNKISVGPGRGSGAGSIVAWALKITDLDPIKYGLLFERFLNPDRISMPDFDIDFCQTRREEVINYVRNKYGASRVANIVTYGKMNAKTAIKDIGRVLHIPYTKLDEISKMIPFNPLEQITIKKALEMDIKFQEQKTNDPEIEQLINIATEVEGLIRHSSMHAAGVIISNEEIHTIAPVEKSDDGFSIISYDMKDAEKIGMVKFDFLGLKTLSVISQVIDLLKQKNIDIDISKIRTDDKKTFELLRSAKLKGIFQFEATVPRMTLKKIQTDKIEDLMAITSLARPGPMGNIPTYIKRKTGEEEVKYYHKALKDSLEETFGIIIYQEQVMQVVQILGGYSLGEADLVRKAMGKKIQEEMDKQRDIFITKAAEKGIISKNEAIEMFDIIAKFAGYGFNRAHAASYALISYQTAYLKAHYTLQFLIANLNLEIEHTDKINFFIIDCKLFSIEVMRPCINNSNVYFQEENEKIRYGLAGLKAVGVKSAEEICKERELNGKFIDLEDFTGRCSELLNKKNLESFILTGALDGFSYSRKTLLNNLDKLLEYEGESEELSLFGNEKICSLQIENCPEFTNSELLKYEFDFFGFYFSSHPLSQEKEAILLKNVISSEQIEEQFAEKDEAAFFISGVVVKFVQRFKKNSRFAFLHMVDFDGMYEVMIFSEKLIDKHRDLLKEGETMILQIDGKNSAESGAKLLVKDIISIADFLTKDYKIDTNKSSSSYKKYQYLQKKKTEDAAFKINEENVNLRSKIITNNNATQVKILTIKCETSDELEEIRQNISAGEYIGYKKLLIKINDTKLIVDL